MDSKQNVDDALTIVHREYFMQVLAILSMDKTTKDFTYTKIPITSDDGGTYLLSIMHVDGPKIDLDKIRKNGVEVEIDETETKKP